MAERAYARLSRMLDHQFREKKPIMLFSSRTDFGQNNVTGDLGEGTGGVTEASRHRMLLNFTGDYKSFEHVLMHEMVHAFQYDIFARGKAGNGLQTLVQFLPPLWFAEGMAEYLSLGANSSITTAWMRDAALYGKIPTIEQLTKDPDKFFPYRYGHSLWTFIGQKWGDEAIGQVMNSVPSVGVERAFRRELGISFEDLSDEWREDLQTRLLPPVGSMDRPRRFAQPLLTEKKSGGEIFLAPALSSDGKTIAFLSNGSFLRGQVFIDLWLGDGETGKRLGRLAKGELDPNFEELRVLYTQSAFSPDGRTLAFTAQSHGKDVLYLADIKSRNKIRLQLRSGRRYRPELVARRQRDRLQRQLGWHYRSLYRQGQWWNAAPADERQVRRPAAAVVARRQDHRLRQRSRQREHVERSSSSRCASRWSTSRRVRRPFSRDRTDSISIHSGRPTAGRSPMCPTAPEPPTSFCTTSMRAITTN